jgi:Mg-chelatase subunit ChlD
MSTAYAVPVVAVPFPDDHGASAPPSSRPGLGQKGKSSYRLPSSRRIGEFAAVPEQTIQSLMKQGYTRGLATSIAQTIKSFPLRIWVVDNSGSMQHTDGHRFVETRRTQDVKVVNCSRWDEIKGCVEYHAQISAALEAPTTFRMLNDPRVGPNSQQFGIAEKTLDPNVIQEEVSRAVAIMNQSQPGGVTPLIKHLREIRQSVEEMAPELNANGTRVAIILATDGLPTDEQGYNNSAVQREFVEALRGLESLPVWVVIRLCTDEESVCEFYNSLDDQLELSLEVLDDFLEEADEVYEHNPWLNYALPLHRLREMGYHNRVFDMIDERKLTHQEIKDFASLLLIDTQPYDQLPDPSADWKEFSRTIKGLLAKQPGQWNPKKKKVTPWIDMKKLDKIYGDSKWKLW